MSLTTGQTIIRLYLVTPSGCCPGHKCPLPLELSSWIGYSGTKSWPRTLIKPGNVQQFGLVYILCQGNGIVACMSIRNLQATAAGLPHIRSLGFVTGNYRTIFHHMKKVHGLCLEVNIPTNLPCRGIKFTKMSRTNFLYGRFTVVFFVKD